MKYLVCNQKMFLTKDEAYELRNNLDDLNLGVSDKLIIAPSFIYFDIFKGYNLCSQNVFYEDKGAFTGEISPYMLSLINVKYALIGHSERRCFDDDKIINLKIKACVKNCITPILCIGETKIERELRKTSLVIKQQLTKAFEGVSLDDFEVFIAYEPRYLIGKNKTMIKDEIEDTIKYIKKVLKELGIEKYKILYGASLNKDNIKKIDSSLLDGYLLGSASIYIDEIKEIIKCIK